jgi:acyl-CoA synthetase (AMP-forming)/AMP-acid ligase II
VKTLGDLLRWRAERGPHDARFGFLTPDGEAWFTYAQLVERARRVAGDLRTRVRRGQRVGIASAGIDFADAFFGCLFAGAVPVPLPTRDGVRAERWRRRLHAIAARARFAAVLGDDDVPVARVPAVESRDDVAFIQFTSGSTDAPRGAVITQSAALGHAHAIARAGRWTEDDRMVSWLPLSHDMGLVGTLLTPLVAGGRPLLMTPEQFVTGLRGFLARMTSLRATVMVMPPSAYALLARWVRASRDFDLSAVRLALVGAEMVTEPVLDAFAERFAPCGFRAEAFTPVYGLAEATLAVTLGVPGRGARSRRGYVSVGPPLDGTEVRVRDGEIQVRGPSVMAGYVDDEEATREALVDGWLRTGDVGFMADGELHVCGRIKDVIKRGGRAYHATDIEAAIAGVDGVLAAAVFGVTGPDGAEAAVAMVETRRDGDAALRANVLVAAGTGAGITLQDVLLVPPGALPRTTSGKLQRFAARDEYLGRAERVVR